MSINVKFSGGIFAADFLGTIAADLRGGIFGTVPNVLFVNIL